MDKKKIILIGSNHKAALELVFKRELESLGNQVHIIPVQNKFLEYYNKSTFNKIRYRFGLSFIMRDLQYFIKNEIHEFKPNLVIVFKGMEVKPQTISWIKAQGIKVCNYNPDHPFIFSGRGSGNSNVTNSIKLFDNYFSYANDVVGKLKKQGVKSTLIPFGFDSDGFNYEPLTEENELMKVCFLGNADNERVHFLNSLAEMGVEIDVYGENWKRYKLNDKIICNSAKYGQQFWNVLQCYAVQLNLLRPHNLRTHNMRSFDIPGAGGIMLAPNTPDHSNFFKPNEEIFLFNDVRDAFQKIEEILGLTFSDRLRIREAARNKAVRLHSYNSRIKELLKEVNAN